ncbi:hypothetical protein SKAU_G00064910 [Synaphobranchus kaupii]|uniref:Uncharacterized protein n=1 Tax=Synaphobranchus kaupii TaxID=118154 RepID=A0A9Q1G630_SYNKA|nr:hypothetical protein SKAU_G00064910 [Synaphobranchus kaupii]
MVGRAFCAFHLRRLGTSRDTGVQVLPCHREKASGMVSDSRSTYKTQEGNGQDYQQVFTPKWAAKSKCLANVESTSPPLPHFTAFTSICLNSRLAGVWKKLWIVSLGEDKLFYGLVASNGSRHPPSFQPPGYQSGDASSERMTRSPDEKPLTSAREVYKSEAFSKTDMRSQKGGAEPTRDPG